MKEPEFTLPLKIQKSKPRPGTAYVYSEDEDDGDKLPLTDWISKYDAEYIVQAANNFPEAVRLLKTLYNESDIMDKQPLLAYEIQDFITKLEEDEKL